MVTGNYLIVMVIAIIVIVIIVVVVIVIVVVIASAAGLEVVNGVVESDQIGSDVISRIIRADIHTKTYGNCIWTIQLELRQGIKWRPAESGDYDTRTNGTGLARPERSRIHIPLLPYVRNYYGKRCGQAVVLIRLEDHCCKAIAYWTGRRATHAAQTQEQLI